jgi:N-acetyl-gamma-glutamyl-phosphate reductase
MINVAIIGASGYTGLELVKILINHPKFNISYLANSSGDTKLSTLHPSMQDVYEIDVEKADVKEVANKADLAFLALPHKTSMAFAKELIALGVKVVDLSADYRLELDTYEEYYCPHEDKDNLPSSVYGLPEAYRDDIAKANLVANPGCYPTASILGLLPFSDCLDDTIPVFVDAKSGVSGAGKKLSELTQFVTVNDNMFVYNPIKHRHAPEIKEKLKLIKSKDLAINFVPSLIPVTRGMLVNIYVTLKDDTIEPLEVLKEYYKGEKHIRIREKPVDLKATAGTNYCDIYAIKNDKALIINVSIDNLLRGASSQAVVNANIIYGLDEDMGIPNIAYAP